LNHRISKLRLRTLDDPGDVFESHAQAIGVGYNHFTKHLGRQRLAFCLQRNALVFGLDKTSAHHPSRNTRGTQHVGNR
jgi:hypothetical protein